jgi:hypothetical protein
MSKLYKFKSYLTLQEAAIYLEHLIDEEVEAEDIYDLFVVLRLRPYLGGNLVGLPVRPPTESTNFEGPWEFINDLDWELPDLFSKYLSYPHQICETTLGKTLLNMVDGVPYAWFKILPRYNLAAKAAANLPNIEPIDGDSELAVLPSDILALAKDANSPNDSPVVEVQPSYSDTVWYLDKDGRKIIRTSQKVGQKTGIVDVQQEQPLVSDAPSSPLAIAALLDLLSQKGRSAANQSAVIAHILERYPGVRGLSKRNLEAIFAAANKAAKQSGA